MESESPRGAVRAWLLGEVKKAADANLAARAAKHFGITRQAVSRHLRGLVSEGIVKAEGNTTSRRYELVSKILLRKTYEIDERLHEHEVWQEDVLPALAGVRPNVAQICEYGFTEIMNNAIDHSESPEVRVTVSWSVANIRIHIADDGVGIFRKIRQARNLETDRHAILELTKGKVTTDPARHTGEGIFFTSRMMDVFVILSDSLGLVHKRTDDDWLYQRPTDPSPGTVVDMKLDPESGHTMAEVFDRYAAAPDDYAFARTHIVLALAQAEGGSLVSRSQAKRIMAGLDRFLEVNLDFANVTTIGPAFADEIFRVWQGSHPRVKIRPSNANEEVQKMIARVERPEASTQT